MNKYKTYINGQWIGSQDNYEIINPDNLSVIGQVPALKSKDIDSAFLAAKTAFKSWKKTSLKTRIDLMEAWIIELEKSKNKIAKMMNLEIAKPLKSSIGEVDRTISYIKYTIEEMKRIQPKSYNGSAWGIDNKLAIFNRVPLGTVLAISPFNYPINLSVSKIAPALISGNTVVLKSSTQGTISNILLSETIEAAGFPKGVFNMVTGRGSDIGTYLITNPSVDMVSFTGSTNVGEGIANNTKMIPLVLEMGGKDPALVLKDADIKKAAIKIAQGAFSYNGQRCTAIKRVIVHNDVADKLISELKNIVIGYKVGSATNSENNITPLISVSSAKYVNSLIKDSLDKGAKLIIGNKSEKNLIWPTIIDNVSKNMKLYYEEPFGPVLPIIRFDNIDEAINIANDSEYGLQASIFTKNIDCALGLAGKIEAGSININSFSQRGPDHLPFLGVKKSGFGVQGITDSIYSMTTIKGIVINYETSN